MEKYEIDVIRAIIREELISEAFSEDLRLKIAKVTSGVVRESIIDELKKIDVPKVLIERFDGLLKNQFEPIILKSIDLSSKRVADKINKQLKQVINLKTSTIMEVQHEIKKIPTTTEEETLKILQIEFPEYYQQVQRNVLILKEKKEVVENGSNHKA